MSSTMTKTKFKSGDRVEFEHEGETITGTVDCHIEDLLYVVSFGSVFTILEENEMKKVYVAD